MKLQRVIPPILLLIFLFSMLWLTVPPTAIAINVSVPNSTPAAISTPQLEAQSVFQIFIPIIIKGPKGRTFYVDSVNGSDANPGTSPSSPWRTLARVNAYTFQPGDIIRFKQGSSWTGELRIDDSGQESNPIIFTTYGTGAKPIFSNPQGQSPSLTTVVKVSADWVILEGIIVQNASRDGVFLTTGSDHNIIRDIEVTNVGLGITVKGSYNLITHNYIHDLHLIINTPDIPNDDGGAVCILLYHDHNEASYNKLIKCIAPSYDFDFEGEAFEFYGNMSDTYIHHNWVAESGRFIEVGGSPGNVIKNTVVAYNVSRDNYRGFSLLNLNNEWAAVVENFRVENNTIIETNSPPKVVIRFNGQPTNNTFLARNNILYISEAWTVSNHSSFIHDHNLYYLTNRAQLGFTLDPTEKRAAPLFANLAEQNYHLQPNSSAINAGVHLGHTLDFEDRPIFGTAPDLGAYEYSPISPPIPIPTQIPTAKPTDTPTVSPTATATHTSEPTLPTTIDTPVPTLTPIAPNTP